MKNWLRNSSRNLQKQISSSGKTEAKSDVKQWTKSIHLSLVPYWELSYPYSIMLCRSDSQKALEVMADNLSVLKTISTMMAPFSSSKNVAIRANIASIVDSVIVRFVLLFYGVCTLLRGMHVMLTGNFPPTPSLPIGCSGK